MSCPLSQRCVHGHVHNVVAGHVSVLPDQHRHLNRRGGERQIPAEDPRGQGQVPQAKDHRPVPGNAHRRQRTIGEKDDTWAFYGF